MLGVTLQGYGTLGKENSDYCGNKVGMRNSYVDPPKKASFYALHRHTIFCGVLWLDNDDI